jgi:hypothetical protein
VKIPMPRGDRLMAATVDLSERIECGGGVGHLSDTPMKSPRGGFPAAPLSNATTDQGAMS